MGQDSWEAVEPVKTEKIKPARAKISLNDRIKLKEEKLRKEREDRLKAEEEERKTQNLTELQREKLAEENEMGLLADTFGTDNAKNAGPLKIELYEPKTKEEFNILNEALSKQINQLEGKTKKKAKGKLMVERDNDFGFQQEETVDDYEDFM